MQQLLLRNAHVHDINFVLPSCKNMKEKGIEMESLIGDKGYISEKIKTFLKDKYNIDYIFPYKKIQNRIRVQQIK